MTMKKINTVHELKKVIDSEGSESDLLEWKDYNFTIWENERDDIIKAICGLANNKGGVFIIGVDDNREIVYTNIDFNSFIEKLDNWVNELIEPKGIKYRPDRVIDENGHCIIVFVEPTSGTCYAQKMKNRYLFPYRTYGATRYYHFEEFFKIYVHKFLKDVAVSGEFFKRKEEEIPIISTEELREKEPFNSELINNYVNLLRTMELSMANVYRILEPIRSELYKIFSRREVNDNDIPAIKNLVEFTSEFMKGKNEEIIKKTLDILDLLTRTPKTLQLVKEISYDYLKDLYERGERYEDLVKILNACGFFEDRISKIMEAIDNRDQKVLDVLVSGLDFTTVKDRKYDIIKNLFLKLETLDPEKDKRIIDKVIYLKNQLEMV